MIPKEGHRRTLMRCKASFIIWMGYVTVDYNFAKICDFQLTLTTVLKDLTYGAILTATPCDL